MKKNKKIIILLIIGIIYILLSKKTNIYIPCLFHKITNLYCPGCGITRMILSLLAGNLKQAYHYNQLLFISTPFFLFFIIESIIANIKNKKALYKRIPNKVYIIYLILLIIFMIIRNIFPYFAPTTI